MGYGLSQLLQAGTPEAMLTLVLVGALFLWHITRDRT